MTMSVSSFNNFLDQCANWLQPRLPTYVHSLNDVGGSYYGPRTSTTLIKWTLKVKFGYN